MWPIHCAETMLLSPQHSVIISAQEIDVKHRFPEFYCCCHFVSDPCLLTATICEIGSGYLPFTYNIFSDTLEFWGFSYDFYLSSSFISMSPIFYRHSCKTWIRETLNSINILFQLVLLKITLCIITILVCYLSSKFHDMKSWLGYPSFSLCFSFKPYQT